MDVPAHYCIGGECPLHGSGRESDEVKVAKINAERDIEVAKLARSETRDIIEAETEQTEIVAEASVEEAVVQADVLEDLAEPEPANESDPVVVEIPAADPEPEPDAAAAPEETEPAAEKTESKGWWAGYR